MIYLVIFILLAVLITVIIIKKVNIELEYTRKEDDDHLIISIYTAWRLIKLKYELQVIDAENTVIKFRRWSKTSLQEKKSENKGWMDLSEIISKIKKFNDINKKYNIIICYIKPYIKKTFILEEIRLDMELGSDDAAQAGILGGLVWGITGVIASFLSNNFNVNKTNLNIKTVFVEKKLNVDLYCIFKAKIVNIILVVLKVLYLYLKIRQKSNNLKRSGWNFI